MLYAVKKQIGEVSARYIPNESELLPDELSIETEDIASVIYDSVLGEVREMNSTDLLNRSKADKIASLKMACRDAIQSGFTSSALGSPHRYDSALPQDQLNILGAKEAGVSRGFTCTDQTGVKWKRFHTAEQLLQVFIDGSTHIDQKTDTLYEKLALVNAATTIETVNGINW